MKNTTFTFEAELGLNIFVRKFEPESETAKGIVIISHGISEHSGRYSSFAEELNKNGYIVYAHDQRSHGSTYVDGETIGTVFAPFNERIQNPKTVNDWICTDEEVVKKYGEDPQCGQPQSISYLYDIALALDVYEMESINKIDKSLSFFVIAGEEDPVCNYTEGPKLISRLYKEAGIKNVDVKTYPGVRHELLNETNKKEVMADTIHWMNTVV